MGAVFLLLLAVYLLWSVASFIAGLLAPTPSIATFTAMATCVSKIPPGTSLAQVVRGAASVPGLKVLEQNEGAAMISCQPSLTSLHRGSGAWLVIRSGIDGYEFAIGRRSVVNTTIFRRAIDELERQVRMATNGSQAAALRATEMAPLR